MNSITVAPDEMARAMRIEAMRYPGQEQQIMEFFRQNPRASDTLRGPIYEEKVVDFVLELAKVEDKIVTPEELSRRTRGRGEAAPCHEERRRPAAGQLATSERRRRRASQAPSFLAPAVWPVGLRPVRLSMQPSLT